MQSRQSDYSKENENLSAQMSPRAAKLLLKAQESMSPAVIKNKIGEALLAKMRGFGGAGKGISLPFTL
jgi:hypothetical protein